MQIYRGFDIGTAKLSIAARRGIPHHLLDFVDPEERFSAGDYARVARRAITEMVGRGRVPVVVGGTGFYLRALLDGLPDLPARNDCLRQRFARRSAAHLHRLLQRLDPGTAQRLHTNDRMRVERALEIRLLAGSAASSTLPGSAMPGFAVRKIGLFPPREQLYRRLDFRTEMMFREGLVEEVQALLARGVPASAKPFEAVGYKQALTIVRGQNTVNEAVAAAQQATRNYAKRQITWFRHDPGIEPVFRFGDELVASALGPWPALREKETEVPPKCI